MRIGTFVREVIRVDRIIGRTEASAFFYPLDCEMWPAKNSGLFAVCIMFGQ